MSFSEWQEVRLGDVISFNPRESIVKNQIAKKVAMEKIKPFTKFIDSYEMAEFKGGTKFRNGDTLLARITPCLENGKTSQVTILNDDEVGFGSTEYIVLREKKNVTNKDYIYYLSISPKFREIAIQSMVGSSGRQRVQQDVLENAEIEMPSLPEQKAIGDTLSCLDDKIELNNRIDKTLEEMAQAIFKSWFVDFEPFQDGEFEDSELGRIPKGWRVGSLEEVCNIKYGKNLPTSRLIDSGYYVFGGNGVIGYHTDYLYEEPQVLISCRGAASGKVLTSYPYSFVTNNSLVLEVNSNLNFEFLQYYCLNTTFEKYTTGSAQPQITIENIRFAKILIPEKNTLKNFSNAVTIISQKTYGNYIENRRLQTIRDTLLPKLMSGEIRVPLQEVQ